jgi:hypothetical protein
MENKEWIAQPKKSVNEKGKNWEVKRAKAERATEDFHTQQEAWSAAKKMARKHGTSGKPATAKLKLKRGGEFSKRHRYPKKTRKHDNRQY